MKYKLIASDMDGTLVNDDAELTVRNIEAILKAVKVGALFVTATGRPFSNVEIVNKLFNKDMPFIVLNGAAAYMGKSRKLLFERFLDFNLAKEAYEIGQKLDIAQILWIGSQLWVNKVCDETVRYSKFSTGIDMLIVDDFDALKYESPGISKVLWIAKPSYIADLRHEMAEHFGEKLNCVSSMGHFLEFISRDSSKGLALAEIGRLYGIDSSEMIAIGDSYNDVSMLDYAGFSVAVENAHDEIKKNCDYISPSNNNDAIAHVIEKFML